MEFGLDLEHLCVCLAQSSRNEKTAWILAEVADSDLRVAKCRQKHNEEHMKKFGTLPRRIAGCWDGCPIIIGKPVYPASARRLGLRGVVRVEAIVDDNGDVVLAKAISGRELFRKPAEAAAKKSRYQPRVDCDGKPIKFRTVITYNFRPSK